jgi:hypothetical protein
MTTTSIATKAGAFINTWQSVEQAMQQKGGQLPKVAEQAGPMALVLNLSRIPVADTRTALEKNPDEAKNHPGVRTTFVILQMLHPGWSSVSTDKDPMSKSKVGAAKTATATEVKEKLSSSFGEHVLMHSYDLINQRGTYTRCGRSNEYMALSPKMVITTKVWGSKFLTTFKEQKTDVEIFDMVLVQFSLKSLQSSALAGGMMLEIKAYNSIPGINPGSFRLLKSPSVPMSLQEAAVARSRFADGSHLSTETTAGEQPLAAPCLLTQDMIKGNLSTTVSLIRAVPGQAQGVFALGPDDKMRFHINEPMSDIPCADTLMVHYDAAIFAAGKDKDWVAKLFNVAVVMKAVELFVAVDTYKSNKAAGGDGEDGGGFIMDCYARLDVSVLISHILQQPVVTPASSVPCIQSTFTDQGLSGSLKYLAVFVPESVPTILFAVDLRRMSKKIENGEQQQAKGSVVHQDSSWDKAHSVHVFFEERLVHCFVVPVTATGVGADGSRKVLETVSVAKWAADEVEMESFGCDNDVDDEDATKLNHDEVTGEEVAAAATAMSIKKRKRASAVVGAEEN